MVPNSALCRSERIVVPRPIASENLQRSVVHSHGNGYLKNLFRILKVLHGLKIDLGEIDRTIEPPHGVFENTVIGGHGVCSFLQRFVHDKQGTLP